MYRYTTNPLVSNTGTSVRGAYGQEVTDEDDETTARSKIEAEVRRHSNRFEWHDDGSISVTHIVPGKATSRALPITLQTDLAMKQFAFIILQGQPFSLGTSPLPGDAADITAQHGLPFVATTDHTIRHQPMAMAPRLTLRTWTCC